MRIDILTILPEMVADALSHSIMQRAMQSGVADIRVVNLRDFAEGRHRVTDDTPCGGGGGMVMKVDPVARALDAQFAEGERRRVALTDPQGERFTQGRARDLAAEPHVAIICGHYEGVDERVREHLATDALSIGDYVLTGGELPALVMVDAVVRLLPGALGEAGAPDKDTFADGLLEYPQYTRPREFRGWVVPDILFSGHHADITKWRRMMQLRRTREWRPDLWARFEPDAKDRKLLKELDAPSGSAGPVKTGQAEASHPGVGAGEEERRP